MKRASLFVFALVVANIGCNGGGDSRSTVNRPDPEAPVASQSPKAVIAGLIVDIPKLIDQSPEAFEKVYGKPIQVSATNDPGTTPGEIRDYMINGVAEPHSTDHGLTVRFHKGKAVSIMFDFPISVDNRDAAFALAGLDVKGKAPHFTAPAAEGWQHFLIGDTFFKRVEAMRLGTDQRFTSFKGEVE